MFTGIVEEVGRIMRISRGAHSAVLEIAARRVLEDAHLGDSIAVNGVCLTVTQLGSASFSADVMHETLKRSSLANLAAGSHVNLERAMAANGRFGGHIVAGHIDDTGIITHIRRDDNAVLFTIEAAQSVLRYIVEKGSVALDGISLTVTAVDRDTFTISAIPHTVAQTVLRDRRIGDVVNVEVDLIGKYVEKLCAAPVDDKGQTSTITDAFLARNGF